MVARVLLPLAVLVALFTSTASAEKPKLAVLGIEVAGSPDTFSTTHGRLLTELFRAKVGVNPRFSLAPNSLKDLLDEKVAGGCETEAIDCMSKIGTRMKAQVLIFGKIEKRPKDGREGYQVSMKSLEIDKKSIREWGDWIPLSDFADNKLDARVARGFDTLTKDESATGTTGNTGNTTGNTGTTGVVVVPTKPNPPKKSTGLGWKITAATATAVTIGLATGGIIFRGKTKDLESNCDPIGGVGAPGLGDEAAYPNQGMGQPSAKECAKGPGYSKNAWITGLSAAAVGGFALFAYYQGFIAKKEGPTQTGGRVRKKKNFAVTPIVSPDGAGATVRLDW